VLGQPCNQPARQVSLGAVLSLTGAHAAEGRERRHAIELAARAAAHLCPPVQFTLQIEDDRSEPLAAMTAAGRLIDAGAFAIIGPARAEAISQVVALAGERGIPIVVPAALTAPPTPAPIYQLTLPPAERARQTVIRVVERMQPRTAAVLVAAHDAVSRTEGAAMRAALDAAGVPVVCDQQPAAEENDYRGPLTAVKRSKPDILFIAAPTDAALRIVGQTRELGIKAPMAGSSGFDALALPKLTGDAAEGIIVATEWHPDTVTGAPFTSAYQVAYGSAPSAAAALAYAAVQVLAEATRHTANPDREGIRTTLFSIEANTVLGPVRFTPDGQAHYAAIIQIIKAGKPTVWP
jgi:branched-chain amino acid transport system substrate-binding protein